VADLALLVDHGFRPAGFAPDSRFVAARPAPHELQAEAPAEAAPDPVAEARAQAYAEGWAAAHEEAAAQAEETARARARFASAFARIDAEQAEALRVRLVATVTALCEATLQPLALDPALLAARVERAVAMLDAAADERLVRLAPGDLVLVRPLLPSDWRFEVDATLEPGALRIETASGGLEDGPEVWRRRIAEAIAPC
jgi:flagellar assembly protein FliH